MKYTNCKNLQSNGKSEVWGMYVGEQQIKYFESYKYMEAIICRDKTLIRQQIKLQYKIHSLL